MAHALEANAVSYHPIVHTLAEDPERLEQAYRAAVQAGEEEAFQRAIEDGYASAPANLLYAAWFHRLRHAAAQAKGFAVAWGWALPLALANGVVFWLLSDVSRFVVVVEQTRLGPATDFLPQLLLLAAPISAVAVLTYLYTVGRGSWFRAQLPTVVLLAVSVYVLWVYPRAGTRPFQEQYLTLMLIHLPLLSWAGVGSFLTACQDRSHQRFAFLTKSLEVFVLGGLGAMAGGVFVGITVLLFEALDVQLSKAVLLHLLAGGAGLIPVLATAVVYNPTISPAEQTFGEGLGKTVAIVPRALLPLTLLVLVVYLAFIPFNLRAPYENREVLIIFNVMLFGVIALLVGATPLRPSESTDRLGRWLRRGIIAVTALALVVGLYALSAIVYRTFLDRLTPNRFVFVGWNVINLGLLAHLLVAQARTAAERWLRAIWRVFSGATVVYVAWALVVVLATPWLFAIEQGELGKLPPAVQDIVYEHPDPILLKCAQSPHIYLLDGGEKRWIDTIETFRALGYVWGDVHLVACEDLHQVPDGTPIPATAGPPPQP